MWDDRIRVAETKGLDGVLDRTMEAWFTAPFRAARPDVIARIRAMLAPTDPVGYVGAIQAIGYGDLREEIHAIRCPTLILVGEEIAAPTSPWRAPCTSASRARSSP